jgi:molybdopterin-guanine dinucleotide biosynthesis protein
MSGKTTRATQISKHLTDQGVAVKLINLESLDLDRNIVQKGELHLIRSWAAN